MIYVYAPNSVDATRFVVTARLSNQHVRAYTMVEAAEGVKFNEEDEVFILEGISPQMRKIVRTSHDNSWPRPHIYQEIKEVRRVGQEAR